MLSRLADDSKVRVLYSAGTDLWFQCREGGGSRVAAGYVTSYAGAGPDPAGGVLGRVLL